VRGARHQFGFTWFNETDAARRCIGRTPVRRTTAGDPLGKEVLGIARDKHVDHPALERFTGQRVNISGDKAGRRRGQASHLRSRLEKHIASAPDYDLVKLRASGSTAKGTAIRRRRGEGSDADVAFPRPPGQRREPAHPRRRAFPAPVFTEES
jgi:hypothetical protein